MSTYLYNYENLKKKYGEFLFPMVKLVVNGKDLKERKENFTIEHLEIDLSSEYEASAVFFELYGCYDEIIQSYKIEELKKYICLGASVSAAIGYEGNVREVFKGFISKVTFLRKEKEAHHIEVTALDIKGLMMSNSCARQMKSNSYGEGIRELFQKGMYQKMQSAEIYTDLKITDTPDKGQQKGSENARTEHIDMVAESDYDFVVKAAKRFNFEFFIENGTVFFRRAKEGSNTIIKLGVEAGILEYEISYDITGLVETVEVRGTDIRKAEPFIVKKKVKNKISIASKAKSLLSQTEKVYIDGSIHSKEQAEYRAKSLAEEMSFRFGIFECKTIGIPELMPGNFIDTFGIGGPGDNHFYITNVKHSLNEEDGFQTEMKGKAAQLQ